MGIFSSLLKGKSTPANQSVCLLIDYENFAISLRNRTESQDVDLEPVLKLARDLNNGDTIAVARAYADWRHFGRYADDLVRLGIQTVQAPNHRLQGKNATDIHMAVEATDLMHLREDLHHYILVTGDSDFNPLVHLLRSRGKKVTGIGIKGTVSPYFEKVCDEFHYYESLLDEPIPNGRKNGGSRVSKPASSSSRPSSSTSKPAGSTMRSGGPASKPPERKPTAAPAGTKAKLDKLGLDPDFLFTPDRLKELIPLLTEVIQEAGPQHVNEMKKALSRRFTEKVSPLEAAALANLFKRVNGYGSSEGPNWLEKVGKRSDDAFDILLATSAQLLKEGNREPRGEGTAALLFGEVPANPSEMNMRQTRGRKLYEEITRGSKS
ncbi:NYN domain-containing protein [bacterium]|nr:NYN domain-containing protein [bacterium]